MSAYSMFFWLIFICAMAQQDVEVTEMKVDMQLDSEGGLPETMEIHVPIDTGEIISLDLVKKEDHFRDVKVIVGSEGEDSEWQPHKGEKFHVYSDLHYHATFSVSINQTEHSNKFTLYGTYHHNNRFYSVRPSDEDFDHSALNLTPLKEWHVIFLGHKHLVTEDKPVTRDHHSARDYIKPDEL